MALAWHLKSRPEGIPTPDNFELRQIESPPLAEGQVRVRNLWLSVDPAMRVRMNADTSGYQPSFALGEPLTGGAVGEVVESRSPHFTPGDRVQHLLGWRDETVGAADALRKLPQIDVPEQYFLHVMGVIGFTAYAGVVTVGEAKAGETLFVSAAGGAVGSAAVQIGKILGLRVIGSAGGPEKCALVRELGADAVVDYKAPGTMTSKLRAAAPDGVDVYLDNVGGDHLDAALALANVHARFAMSGMVSAYNGDGEMNMHNLVRIVVRRLKLQGYMPRADFPAAMPEFQRVMAGWIKEGKVRSPEEIRDGIAQTPQGFIELFTGGVPGKMLIRL